MNPFADLDRKVLAYAELRKETKVRLKKLGANLLRAHPLTGAWRCSISLGGKSSRVRFAAPSSDELIAEAKQWWKKHGRVDKEAA